MSATSGRHRLRWGSPFRDIDLKLERAAKSPLVLAATSALAVAYLIVSVRYYSGEMTPVVLWAASIYGAYVFGGKQYGMIIVTTYSAALVNYVANDYPYGENSWTLPIMIAPLYVALALGTVASWQESNRILKNRKENPTCGH